MRKLFGLFALLGAMVLLAACSSLFPEQSAPPSQPIINNITPVSGGDGGVTVLATVFGIVALLGVAGGVALLFLWRGEKALRVRYEGYVTCLTGQPADHVMISPSVYRPTVAVTEYSDARSITGRSG